MQSLNSNLGPVSFSCYRPKRSTVKEEALRVLLTKENTGWKKWGTYMTYRQWGTVREDYSESGDAWSFIDHYRSNANAYRWGEEGIGGFCDSQQNVCIAPAFWNGKDEILKENLFGLTNSQGNHGEDVKEMYFQGINTPTHSYAEFHYIYPIDAFPYKRIQEENQNRGIKDLEFEIWDTGVFDNNRFFDIKISYAKESDEDMYQKITVKNCSDTNESMWVIPQVWFRNYWRHEFHSSKPILKLNTEGTVDLYHEEVGEYHVYYKTGGKAMFCDNETNLQKVYGIENTSRYTKDGINNHIVNGEKTINDVTKQGTKFGVAHKLVLEPGESKEVIIRFSKREKVTPFDRAEACFEKREKEAKEFYQDIVDEFKVDKDHTKLMFDALSGVLWSKQFYYYDVNKWLEGENGEPKPHRDFQRNNKWRHLVNKNILLMPDKWEYPWYAAWDLAFHTTTMAYVDSSFAKRQLGLMLREYYMHPNGQIPAYEWNFNDVNPPVHAWACLKVFDIDRKRTGRPDFDFLQKVFQKLLVNFTWWVNQKDNDGKNLFEGGFLGLDNIGVFDRSNLPKGIKSLEQADATSWMAMYCLNMLRISLELSKYHSSYQESASKFFQHYMEIAGVLEHISDTEGSLWDPEDEFFYDVVKLNNGETHRMKVRSLVGLIPLFAVEVIPEELYEGLDAFQRRSVGLMRSRPDLASLTSRIENRNSKGRHLFALLRGHRLQHVLKRMLSESEFLSDYGIRSLSKYHENNPYELQIEGVKHGVSYVPGESNTVMFGGNSNWRGPVWFPMNYMLIESLKKYYYYYGDDYVYEFPEGSGNKMPLDKIILELEKRLLNIFDPGNGKEKVYEMDHPIFHSEHIKSKPHMFYEYFHGDTGRGLGAAFQTGWTSLIANLLIEKEK